jgi:hypothetical protein
MGRSPARTKLSFVCAMLVPASLFGQTPDEAAARAALDRDPPAQDLVIRAKALSFPDPSHPGIVALVAEVPGGELRYEIDRAKTSYKADAIVLFRIRDGAGRTVRTVSAHEARTGPFADLDGARAQPVTFYRQMELLPGTYTIDAAVYDTLSGLAGVQRSRLEAPETSDAGKLRLSTLTLVKALERVPESALDGPPPELR